MSPCFLLLQHRPDVSVAISEVRVVNDMASDLPRSGEQQVHAPLTLPWSPVVPKLRALQTSVKLAKCMQSTYMESRMAS